VNLKEKYKKEYYTQNENRADSDVIDAVRQHPNALSMYRYSEFIYGDIIDVGSNLSATTLIAAESDTVISALGVDLNQTSVDRFNKIKEYAKNGAKEKTSMLVANVLELDAYLEENTFDALLTYHMLEHLYPEDLNLAIIQMKRVLKPGGYLIISIPWEMCLGSPIHITFWNDVTLKRLFETHAFKTHECYRADPRHLTGAFLKE